MNEEGTGRELPDRYDEIAESVARGCSLALIGERRQALCVLREAQVAFMTNAELLRIDPDGPLLEHALRTALAALEMECLFAAWDVAPSAPEGEQESDGRQPSEKQPPEPSPSREGLRPPGLRPVTAVRPRKAANRGRAQRVCDRET